MSKKAKFILIFLVVLVGLIFLGFYLTKNKQQKANSPVYNLYQKFNPFTPTNTNIPGGNGDITDNIINNGGQSEGVQRLTKLTDFAISGAVFFEEKKPATGELSQAQTTTDINNKATATTPAIQYETIPSLRYVERATGHIYQMNLSNGSSGKISNSTIPGVYEALFNGDASSVVYRYVSPGERSITSFLATLGGKSEFLSSDILETSLSPLKDQLFEIIKTKSGVSGYTRSFSLNNTKQVFSSSFTEWLPQWINDKNIILTSKPSYLVNGSVFSLDITNGTLTKIIGGIPGITTLSDKTGKNILYGASLDVGPKMYLFNINDHTSKDLGVYGLPEKCTWNKDGSFIICAVPSKIMGTQFPDSWYQGNISFDDYFIKIDAGSGSVTPITSVGEGESIDAINLFFNNDESKIFFTNKKDYTLWGLDLN